MVNNLLFKTTLKLDLFKQRYLMLFFLIIIFIKNALNIQAQSFTRLNIEFQNYKTPLAGGMNCPQLSEVDLNGDGKQDIFAFDRIGNVVLTFLNAGLANQVSYTHTPQYQALFPALNDWALLRDYNGDGIADIFTYNDQPVPGIRVFRGQRVNNTLNFQRINFNTTGNVINYPLLNGQSSNLYVNNVDIPAIDDIDGDGDLDILSFEIGGGHVYFYKNLSIEKGFKKDSLIFELNDQCWGRFFDNGAQSSVKLGKADSCASSFAKILVERAHPGASLATFDRDGDGDKDLILGSISYPTLTELTNGGSKNTAFMSAQTANFPATTEGVNIVNFPAAYIIDVNNDSKKDVIATPSSTGLVENLNVGWLYLNNGTAAAPSFNIFQKNFLVGDMVDLGTGAYPAFVDFDADGLMDLVVGNNTFFKTNSRESRLFLFKNTGTIGQPKFTLFDSNWLNFKDLSNEQNFNFSPAFADMDGDGDVDLIVGEDSGTLFFVENKGGAGKPLSMATPIPNWKSIQAGVAGKPTIADLNNDGLPDLIIGNRSGFLRYFQNTGTRTTPNFTTTAINSFLGRVDTRALGSPTGFSAPVFFKQNGLWQLVVGSEEGKLYYYDQIEGNLAGNFRLVSSDYGTLREGWQTAPTFADVNGDKKMELVVGNLRGGFAVYSSSIPTGVRDIIYEDLVEVFPNPTSNYFFINKKKDDILTLKIYNTLGQMILSQKMAAPQLQTDFSAYQSGIYFLEIMTDDFKKQVIKIVKQ